LPPNEESDPARYPKVLQQWRGTTLVDHFPSAIPAEAQHVRLSSFPGFLQGGGWIQVRLQLPAEQIRQLLDEYELLAIKRFDGGCKADHYNACKVASADFRTSDLPTSIFPPDYTIFVLRNFGGWNHGGSCGVAIHATAGEIVYWTERW